MASGLKTAVSYSLPSYQLGFCGPQELKSKNVLGAFAAGQKIEAEKVKEVLKQFEAPYPYFKLIAKSNDLDDPFDEKVVKAMWIGNSLLENVRTQNLRKMVITDFVKPSLLSPSEAKDRAEKIPDGAVPHHSFHVMILGPVSGRVDLKGPLLDLCRIGWGKVTKATPARIASQSDAGGSNKLQVISKPLILDKKMRLGEDVKREIGWNKKIVPKVKDGDWISFHWGEACAVLNNREVKDLEYYTQKTINLVNARNK